MPTVHIDLSGVSDKRAFHDTFSQALGFPEFYGRNMDAWIDCMGYVDAPDACMSTVHVQPGEVLCLHLEGVKGFASRCPGMYEALLECTAFVNWRRTSQGGDAILALSFYT